jgi:hypothetical protein
MKVGRENRIPAHRKKTLIHREFSTVNLFSLVSRKRIARETPPPPIISSQWPESGIAM